MCVQHNIEARSFSHCCSGKGVSITYSECFCSFLGIQHALRLRDISICYLSGSSKFFHFIS